MTRNMMPRSTLIVILVLTINVTSGSAQAAPTKPGKVFDIPHLAKWLSLATELPDIVAHLRAENRPATV